MGEEITSSAHREIEILIEGEDFLDYVDLIKNGINIKRFNPQFRISSRKEDSIRAKIRFEWGWGRHGELTEWEGSLKLSDGHLRSINPCFRGQPISDQDQGDYGKGKALISRITKQSETECSFHSYSMGNPTPHTPLNSSLVLDVEMPANASIHADVNGRHFEHTLGELLEGQRSHLVGGFLDVAVSFHRAVPERAFLLKAQYIDSKPELETDYYYVLVRQMNNHWAWSSPIWVKSSGAF